MIPVIGAGLAGSEAAYFLAQHGVKVALIDMKPKCTPAHTSSNFGELVCSNSLKSDDVFGNACGLLKEEMRRLSSLTMAAAEVSRVPAGGALAVDREKFSAYITEKLRNHPNITIISQEAEELPERGIVATGPLTAGKLAEAIAKRFGALHFYDASAPIVSAESIDSTKAFTQDRYGRGTGDYINCPMNKFEYEAFVDALISADRAVLREFEKRDVFEGCMPVEVMAERGKNTLRFGPFKPVGLEFEGMRPYAVLQLRKENEEGTSYNLVGCQTNLKFGEQKRVFSMIPALAHAEFERYGVMHRNTYLESPKCLNADFSSRDNGELFFAGQMTGVEGYVESAASGLICGYHVLRRVLNKPTVVPEATTVIGALSRYIAAPNKNFQPMNANYGILAGGFESVRDKKERKKLLSERALSEIERFKAEVLG
ncbi:MAG: methylenetetrahydrofolate--tRNA-(uracil(54)-C(5))-methyltransferase (FADH(2)-oxidizing) TrmFO [Clostridia bacterium]|nr:methylenetetrahydrofolate--tRNA-(uracil(54)-C(5))-methyltransferase (FADH(2)-oxidizing) TrmFO [Clostridia bacterium]